MRRLLRFALLLTFALPLVLAAAGTATAVAAAGTSTAVAAAGTPTAAARRAPAHLLINAQEWSLWPSRTTVPAGTVLVELWNRGQDAHDSWIRRLASDGQMVGPVLGRVRKTLPGQVSQATWHLKAGRYEIYCSMPGHMALGMHTRLTVTRG